MKEPTIPSAPRRFILLSLLFIVSSPWAGPLPRRPIVESDQLLPKADLQDLPYLALCSRKKDGTLRDPVNLALVGEQEDLLNALIVAGWFPADRDRFKAVFKEITHIIGHGPYPKAPMSHSWLFSRKEDFAFEQEVDGSPKRRHHVRIWKTPLTLRGVPIWALAASYDKGIRLMPMLEHSVSKTVDVERDYLAQTLRGFGALERTKLIPGVDAVVMHDANKFITDGWVLLGFLKKLPVLRAPETPTPEGKKPRI